MIRFAALAAIAAATLALPAAAPAREAASPAASQSALSSVLADPRRAADRPRDAWRHPAETMRFFRVEPGMTVVDYMPSGGWWTRILVPYLGSGKYIGLNPDVRTATGPLQQHYSNMAATFPARAAEWTGADAATIRAWNTDVLPAELNGTVDRVLIFREMHNLWRANLMHRELSAVRRLLKADGLLGIEQHRAKANAPADYTDGSKGYMREKDVIAMVEAHGFQLLARSEVNANRRDPANHSGGVWMLPPNSRGVAEADKARLAAIGETDRMTLLFRKRP